MIGCKSEREEFNLEYESQLESEEKNITQTLTSYKGFLVWSLKQAGKMQQNMVWFMVQCNTKV